MAEENRNIFDDQLREALGGLSGDVNPGDWERIASALDRMDAADAEFDNSLKDAASDLEGPVTTADWNTIEGTLVRRRRIVALWWSVASILVISAGLWLASDIRQNGDLTTEQNSSPKIQQKGDAPENGTIDKKDLTIAPKVTTQEQVVGTTGSGQQIDKGPTGVDKPNGETPKGPTHLETGTPSGHDVVKVETPTSSEQLVRAVPPFVAIHLNRRYPLGIDVNAPLKLENPISLDLSDLKLKKPGGALQAQATWEFGVRVTPNIGLLQSVANPLREGLIHNAFFDITDNSEKSTAGYTFGVHALRYVGPNFYIGSGVQFSQKVERVEYHYNIDSTPLVDYERNVIIRYREIDPALRERIDYDGINTFNFVEIPIKFGTIVPIGSRNTWELRAEYGISMMTLVNANGKKPQQTTLTLYDLDSYKELRKMALGMEAKGGLYYRGMTHFRLGIEPYFGMGITSLYSQDAPTKLRPYNYGLNVTANYILFKK